MSGAGKPDPKREAAAAEYGRQLASLDLDALEVIEDEPTAVVATSAKARGPATSGPAELKPPPREPSATSRPNLEPVDDEAHPPQNRRIPTQPPDALALALDGISEDQVTRGAPPASVNAGAEQAGGAPGLPPPKLAYPRASPAPTQGPAGLFGEDRITNLLAGAAIGLLLAVYPAKKLAQSYETAEVSPRLADLETSIAQTLAVDAGLVESPESVVKSIDEGRGKARQRFYVVWLLAGLPIGLGLGFVPRFWD